MCSHAALVCDVVILNSYFLILPCLDPTLPPNQYQVSVQSTEASRRCKLAGKYLVSPEKEAVILLACNTGHIVYCWPYRLLRKFGHVEVNSLISHKTGKDTTDNMFSGLLSPVS